MDGRAATHARCRVLRWAIAGGHRRVPRPRARTDAVRPVLRARRRRALASSGRDFIRAQQLRRECAYLIELHSVARVVLLFHGPAAKGPAAAVCADYRRKMAWASPDIIHARQRQDSGELIDRRDEWAGQAAVVSYRCEVHAGGGITFRALGDATLT